MEERDKYSPTEFIKKYFYGVDWANEADYSVVQKIFIERALEKDENGEFLYKTLSFTLVPPNRRI
jgi:hypothetical protein